MTSSYDAVHVRQLSVLTLILMKICIMAITDTSNNHSNVPVNNCINCNCRISSTKENISYERELLAITSLSSTKVM